MHNEVEKPRPRVFILKLKIFVSIKGQDQLYMTVITLSASQVSVMKV
jgi:hypothetical protein